MFICSEPQTRLLLTKSPSFVKLYSLIYKILVSVLLRKYDIISREFFTNEELVQILDVSQKMDPLIYQMVVIASCTGLRLKDICYLKWKSINLELNRIHLTTYKTKQDATVGLWPLLRKLLDSLWNPDVRPEDYILPNAAEQYSHNSANLLERLRKVLVACGYENARKPYSIRTLQHADLEQLSKEETIQRVESAIEKSDWSARRRMALLYFRSYMKGLTLDEIAKGLASCHSIHFFTISFNSFGTMLTWLIIPPLEFLLMLITGIVYYRLFCVRFRRTRHYSRKLFIP